MGALGEDALNERRELLRRGRRPAARDRGLERRSSGRVRAHYRSIGHRTDTHDDPRVAGECVRPGARLVGRHMWASGSAACADISGDPPIAGFNELDRALAVCEVRVDGCRQRRGVEALEWHGELDGRSVLIDRVLQVEEVHVAREVAEQAEEVCVQGERVAQRAGLLEVVPADALQRQIEPVLDLRGGIRASG